MSLLATLAPGIEGLRLGAEAAELVYVPDHPGTNDSLIQVSSASRSAEEFEEEADGDELLLHPPADRGRFHGGKAQTPDATSAFLATRRVPAALATGPPHLTS